MSKPLTYLDLCWHQHIHDSVAHRDIVVLPKMKRLSHLNHHMTKYLNRISNEAEVFADMLAVTLSATFAFQFDLGKELAKLCESPYKTLTLDNPPRRYLEDKDDLIQMLRSNLSNQSKTIESFDHLEDHDYYGNIRKQLSVNIILIFQLHYVTIKHGWSYEESVRSLIFKYYARLKSIREANPFYDYFQEELDKLSSFQSVVKSITSYIENPKHECSD